MPSSFGSSSSQDHTQNFDRRFRDRFNRRLSIELVDSGIPKKALADELRLDQSQLSRILSDSCLDQMPLSRLPDLTAALGPGCMEWLAIQCGGRYVQMTEPVETHEDDQALAARLAGLSGQAVSVLLSNPGGEVLSTLQALRSTIAALIEIQERR